VIVSAAVQQSLRVEIEWAVATIVHVNVPARCYTTISERRGTINVPSPGIGTSACAWAKSQVEKLRTRFNAVSYAAYNNVNALDMSAYPSGKNAVHAKLSALDQTPDSIKSHFRGLGVMDRINVPIHPMLHLR
jgi:hypothetical protein